MRLPTSVAVLALAAVSGCVLTTGQVMVAYDLESPVRVTGPNALVAVQVDLADIPAYRDHKSGLQDLADIALLGSLTNESSGDPIDVEVWMTHAATQLQEVTQVRAQGIPLWGPQSVPARGSQRLGWDTAAELVYDSGREALAQEAKGDGIFTLYFIDRASIYNFTVNEGSLVLVLNTDL